MSRMIAEFYWKRKNLKISWNVYKEGKTLWKSLGKDKSSVWVVTEQWIEIWNIENNKLLVSLRKKTETLNYEINYIYNLITIFFRNKSLVGRVNIFGNKLKVFYNGSYKTITVLKSRSNEYCKKLPKENKTSVKKEITSPMPGKVTKVFVQNNDKISIGDNLLVLDAMKMENIIKADFFGTVNEVKVSPNDSVAKDELLITFK